MHQHGQFCFTFIVAILFKGKKHSRKKDYFYEFTSTNLIIQFKASKHWILKANVDTDNIKDQRVGFMGFKWGGDCQSGSCIAVHNVH